MQSPLEAVQIAIADAIGEPLAYNAPGIAEAARAAIRALAENISDEMVEAAVKAFTNPRDIISAALLAALTEDK